MTWIQSSWWVTRPGVLGTSVTYRCLDGPEVGTRHGFMEHDCRLPANRVKPWKCPACDALFELREDGRIETTNVGLGEARLAEEER